MTRPRLILLEEPNAFPENVTAMVALDDKAATKVGPTTYRKRILRYGRWQHDAAPGGVLAVDRGYGKRLVQNFTAKVFDTVGANIGHPTNDAERIATAAGDVVGLEDADDGVYALVTVPPPVAADIDAGKIKGCSAGIIPNYVDKEIGGRGPVGPALDHLAFTNKPYIKGLGDFAPVHLADDSPTVVLSLSTDPALEAPMDKTELIAKATELGIDIPALEAAAAQAPTLEAELAALKAAAPADPEAVKAEAKTEAQGELVAVLSDALGGAGLITLAEGDKPTLATLVGSIANSLKAGSDAAATLQLSEATHAVDALVKAGKILPTQVEAMVKLHQSDRDTFTALVPAQPIVDLAEHGTTGAIDDGSGILLADGSDAAGEIERLLATYAADIA